MGEDSVSDLSPGVSSGMPGCAAASERQGWNAATQHDHMNKMIRRDYDTTLSSTAMTFSDGFIAKVVEAITQF